MAPSANALKRSRGPATANHHADGAPQPKSKKAKVEANRSLFVRSLPPDATSESLADYFSQHFPVKHATVVVDQATKESRGFGFVTLTDAEDALEAKAKLNNELWEGRRITVDLAEARNRDQNSSVPRTATLAPVGKQKKSQAIEEAWVSPKLIIRNLPWSVKTPAQLQALFQSYGKIKFADLPMNNGRLRGFGFVTIRGEKNAENAIKAMNGKGIDGRTIAVDWAVEKEEWDNQQGAEADTEKPAKPAKKIKEKPEEKPESKTEKTAKKSVKSAQPASDDADAQLNADLENFMKNTMGNLEDEEDSDEEEESDEDDDEDDGAKLEESDEEEESDAEESKPTEQPEAAKKTTNNDSTVFIRNLPFTTTDEQLKSHFARFGPVRYARVVMDRATDRPAGTGFVCFFDEADSKACVKNAPRSQAAPLVGKHSILQDETADPEGKYTLDGRLLSVAQAVSKDDAGRLAADAGVKRRANDKRRLFLLEEGQLDTRSAMYKSLSQAEIMMRDKSRQQRKKLVEGNPSLHISLTRLAVRNIPHSMTSKELKQLAREACVGFATDVTNGLRQPLSKEEKARANKEAKEAEHNRKLKGKGIVRQAKIEFESRDGSKVTEAAGGKSRGYGFIEYSSHRWALMGLRWLNGHQMDNDQGRKQRLVAEFAIENAQVVQRRKATEGKQTSKKQEAEEDKEEPADEQAPEPEKKTAKHKSKPSQKSSKKFALKTGAKPPGSAKPAETSSKPASKTAGGSKTAAVSGKKAAKEEQKEDMQHKLIARKRLMRKKKAQSRGKA
ncbi:RNA recognition motif-containing protein [Verticillium nonalfalfae]|uniref:RNA recognition motif-containing protein n=1 Tax=Verticillium nonalfalfae TaxID=1051616 RepID=A0A3M9Y5V0_9PEZI|nr:RNA recognition motif-containing protein [Verticillium nonalfalfae]RNJ55382.1 RNA recognition motif-containing protein [Verticillium nonalfalfae]